MNGNARAYSRKNGFFDDVRFARAGFRRRLDYGAPLGRRDACGNGYHHLGTEEVPFAERFFDVVAKHCFRDAVIRDDAVFHRALRDYFIRRTTYHFLRVVPDGEYSVVRLRHGDDRRLVEDDTLSGHEYEYGRRA